MGLEAERYCGWRSCLCCLCCPWFAACLFLCPLDEREVAAGSETNWRMRITDQNGKKLLKLSSMTEFTEPAAAKYWVDSDAVPVTIDAVAAPMPQPEPTRQESAIQPSLQSHSLNGRS